MHALLITDRRVRHRFCATLAGGALALRFRDQLHLILGFSAGAIVGLTFFDLLPEALKIGRERSFDDSWASRHWAFSVTPRSTG